MGSRGSKKKSANYDRTIKAAEHEKERKKRERKLWWQMHKKIVIIVLCAVLALSGIIIGVSVKSCSSDTGGTTGQYTLMDLGSSGCAPCDNLQPILSNLRTKYSGKISVKFYDVNRSSEGARLANKYGVSTIPTLLFLDKSGKVVKRMVGYQTQSTIESTFRSLGWT